MKRDEIIQFANRPDVAEAIAGGMSMAEVARAFSVPYKDVQKITNLTGIVIKSGRRGKVPSPTPSRYASRQIEVARAMRRSGATFREIGETLTVSRQHAHRLYRKGGGE